MPVDYRRQYEPDQLEPLWPNGGIRLAVSSLCALSIMIVLAVLPVLLDYWGLGHWLVESEPADPRVTPIHIRPEWYFLAVYQCLKLFPTEFLGISGKTLGVLSQAVFMLAVALLPFWARRGKGRPPGVVSGFCVTAAIVAFIGLTFWGAWPPQPLLVISVCATVILFYVLVASERRRIRHMRKRREDQR